MVTDLHGVTGRDIMDHLIAGERDPKVLAQLARARARRKITELEHALDGAEFFTGHHAALLQTMLARIDQIDAQITELTAVIEELLAPCEEQLQQAESMPGWGRRSAQDVLAETGPDMTRFATGGHLASWAGRIPLDKQSGKRHGQARHKKGNKYIGAATGETAVAAGKTQTREGARYRKLARTRGKNKACVALGNTQLKVYHKLLSSPGMRYEDLGPDYYDNRARPAARSPTTSASSKPSASKSPSAASPNPTPPPRCKPPPSSDQHPLTRPRAQLRSYFRARNCRDTRRAPTGQGRSYRLNALCMAQARRARGSS